MRSRNRRRTDNTMAKGNDLQNITQKTKDRATRTLLKTAGELRCSGRVSSYCSTREAYRFTVEQHEHQMTLKSCCTPV